MKLSAMKVGQRVKINADDSADRDAFYKELKSLSYMSSLGVKPNTLVAYARSKSEIKEITDMAQKYKIGFIKTDFDRVAGKFYVVLRVPSSWWDIN